MSAAVITLSAIAGGSSLIAAYYWSRSTKIKLSPVFPDWSLPGTGGMIEPVDPDMKSWICRSQACKAISLHRTPSRPPGT